jgi:tetratricopeptide (TPR) repeat protein
LARRTQSIATNSGVTHGRTRRTPDPEAQEFYLKGRYYWNRRTGDSLNQAVDAYIQAIVHDSEYAEAYAGLADTYDLMPEYTPMPASVAYPRAIAAATKAVALDDSLPEAHRALAFGLFYWNWEIPRALAEFRRAIQLDPSDIEAHHWYSTSLSILGRFDESLAEIEKARKLSPASRSILADRALIAYAAGDRKNSIDALKEIEHAEPDFLSPPRYLASMLFQQKDYPGFISQTRRAALISNDAQEEAVAEAAGRGWKKEGERGMLEEMERTQQKFFEDGKSSGFALAYTCTFLHRKKDAVRYLQAAFAARDLYMLTIVRDPIEPALNGEPDFEQLKKQMQAYIDGSAKISAGSGAAIATR